jgi:hypothetical protein
MPTNSSELCRATRSAIHLAICQIWYSKWPPSVTETEAEASATQEWLLPSVRPRSYFECRPDRRMDSRQGLVDCSRTDVVGVKRRLMQLLG